MGFVIKEMYAFVAIDPKDGDEGIMGFLGPDGKMWVPMVGADMKRVSELRKIADELVRHTDMNYRIKRFQHVDDIL